MMTKGTELIRNVEIQQCMHKNIHQYQKEWKHEVDAHTKGTGTRCGNSGSNGNRVLDGQAATREGSPQYS